MNASELIQVLQRQVEQHGDHPIMISCGPVERIDFEPALSEAGIVHPAYIDIVGR